jgi:hypothetical protein
MVKTLLVLSVCLDVSILVSSLIGVDGLRIILYICGGLSMIVIAEELIL